MPQVSTSDRQILRRAAIGQLEYGLLENHPATVKDCIDDGVDVNAITTVSGARPLDLALEMCNVSIMRLLLEVGAEIEGKNTKGSTVLINASKNGYLECVKLLVKHGANLYAHGADGKTCLHAALKKGHYSVVEFLLTKDAHEGSVRSRGGLSLLQHLILTDDAASISNLKYCEVDLNVGCRRGIVPLFFALKHHKNNSLKGLLQAGANPNIRLARRRDRSFALQEAVREENADAVKLLIEHGADVYLQHERVQQLITTTIASGSLSMVRLLLDCGVDIEQDLGHGITPLLAACARGFVDVVQLLVDRGANLKARAVNGTTCLLIAMRSKRHSVADYLLDQDVCEVNGIGTHGLSALHHAVLSNKADLMSKLIQKQANVNVQNHDGEVPIFAAAKRDALNLLRMLLEAGANPNIDTKDGDFALHEAVRQGNVEAVKLLLRHGADRTRLDRNGITPVEVAMALVPPPQDIIQYLLTDLMDKHEPGPSHLVGDHVEDKKKISDSEMEQNLCCPITFEIMKDPVIAMDGHTYEREAIEEWIRMEKTSPVTRQPITSSTLIPNLLVKRLVDQFANMDSNA